MAVQTFARLLTATAVAALSMACVSAAAADRDAIPAYRDQVIDAPRPTAPSAGSVMIGAGAYDYVARRPLAVVALAEARGIEAGAARAAVDRLADGLDTCATEHAHAGAVSTGAARVIAQIDEKGAVTATQVHVEPGPHVAEDALLCLVAPIRLLTFSPSPLARRGIAIEALWGKLP